VSEQADVDRADREGIVVGPLRPDDAHAARELILAGLAEHWGTLDLTKNQDLDDITLSYAGAVFLVARQNGLIVGTGALVAAGDGIGQVMRMSVAAPLRRCGLGSRILSELLAHARALGLRQVVLETTETWKEVVAFYLRNGFHITHRQDGDSYFALDL
jgi:putative acetyltransferase